MTRIKQPTQPETKVKLEPHQVLLRPLVTEKGVHRATRHNQYAFEVHRDNGSRLGGVHLELTGENVTECTGGARDLLDTDLTRAYKSTVDPRLNYEQALELAMLIVRKHNAA